MRRLVAIAAALTLVTSCSATPSTRQSATTPTTTAPAGVSVKPPSDTNSVSARIDGMNVTVGMPDGAAPGGEKLTVAAATTQIPAAKAQVAGAQTVQVHLGDKGAQPAKPLTLTFDLADKPDLANKFSDTVIPLVESSSDDGTASDLHRATWDPATKTVTTTTSHLSNFRLGAIDLGKVAEGVAADYRARLGDTTSACREKSELTIGGRQYRLTATVPGPVAGCLVNSGGVPAIEFTNTTGLIYGVTSTPKATWSANGRLGSADIAAQLGNALSLNSSHDLLMGTGSGKLTFASGVDQATIQLNLNGAALFGTALPSGLGLISAAVTRGGTTAVAELLNNSSTAVTVLTCLDQALRITETGSNARVSPDEYRRAMATAGGCATAGAEAVTDDRVAKQGLNKIGVVFSILGDLPDTALSGLTGAIEGALGHSALNFALSSTTESASAKPAAEGPTTIDRVEVFTWAYNKVGPDTYKVARGGPLSVYFQWKAYAGDKEVRGGCDTTITLVGGGTTKTKTTSNCGSYNPGTYFDLSYADTYTATITIVQKSGGTRTETKTVTLVP